MAVLIFGQVIWHEISIGHALSCLRSFGEYSAWIIEGLFTQINPKTPKKKSEKNPKNPKYPRIFFEDLKSVRGLKYTLFGSELLVNNRRPKWLPSCPSAVVHRNQMPRLQLFTSIESMPSERKKRRKKKREKLSKPPSCSSRYNPPTVAPGRASVPLRVVQLVPSTRPVQSPFSGVTPLDIALVLVTRRRRRKKKPPPISPWPIFDRDTADISTRFCSVATDESADCVAVLRRCTVRWKGSAVYQPAYSHAAQESNGSQSQPTASGQWQRHQPWQHWRNYQKVESRLLYALATFSCALGAPVCYNGTRWPCLGQMN